MIEAKMTDYISREAFLAEKRHLYCENCARRKGMKNGKMKFIYEIGDAPCRACDIGDVLDDVEDFPAADVRPVVRGKWIQRKSWTRCVCSACSWEIAFVTGNSYNFCPNCGADMREES